LRTYAHGVEGVVLIAAFLHHQETLKPPSGGFFIWFACKKRLWQNETKPPFKSSAMKFSDSISLQGQHASLVPLTMAHHDGLCEAVKDGELWKLWYTSIPSPETMKKEIDRRLDLQKLGSMNPFVFWMQAARP